MSLSQSASQNPEAVPSNVPLPRGTLAPKEAQPRNHNVHRPGLETLTLPCSKPSADDSLLTVPVAHTRRVDVVGCKASRACPCRRFKMTQDQKLVLRTLPASQLRHIPVRSPGLSQKGPCWLYQLSSLTGLSQEAQRHPGKQKCEENTCTKGTGLYQSMPELNQYFVTSYTSPSPGQDRSPHPVCAFVPENSPSCEPQISLKIPKNSYICIIKRTNHATGAWDCSAH